jgi:hypothetical protein
MLTRDSDIGPAPCLNCGEVHRIQPGWVDGRLPTSRHVKALLREVASEMPIALERAVQSVNSHYGLEIDRLPDRDAFDCARQWLDIRGSGCTRELQLAFASEVLHQLARDHGLREPGDYDFERWQDSIVCWEIGVDELVFEAFGSYLRRNELTPTLLASLQH